MSSRRLVDLDPFAAALERREREIRETRSKSAPVIQPTVAPQATVAHPATVAPQAAEPLHDATVARHARVAHTATVARYAIVENEYTSVPNDIWDDVMPTLNVYDQVVLWRLYRLARGHHSEMCMVGLEKLAKHCNIGKRQVSTSVERLEKVGLIERKGADFGNANKAARGTIYKINLPAARVAPSARAAPQTTVASHATVAQYANNKEHTLNKHTQTQDAEKTVGVDSAFSLEACRKYAEHLHKSGQGINNPGGYAKTIHRTGEADALIENFINPPAATKPIDTSQCPDCKGLGWWYPEGQGSGVAKCKHDKLQDVPETEQNQTAN